MNPARWRDTKAWAQPARTSNPALIDKELTPSYLSAGFMPHEASKRAVFTHATAL
jgi:hypothetical protein